MCVGGWVGILHYVFNVATGKTEVYDPDPAIQSFFTSILPHTFQEWVVMWSIRWDHVIYL